MAGFLHSTAPQLIEPSDPALSMNKLPTLTIAAFALAASVSGTANATIMFDQNVTPDVIFGSGNDNGSFTVLTTDDGVEFGLRAKLRFDAAGNPQNIFNSNGDGTYNFDAGVAPTQAFPTAIWSFEWSVNTDTGNSGFNLDDFVYELWLDADPGLGTSFLIFDPINVLLADHAIGDNSTGNGGGTVAGTPGEYTTLLSDNTVAQNSWQPGQFFPGFDPTVAGVYDIRFGAYVPGAGFSPRPPPPGVGIQVIVGNGTVPLPGTLLLLGTALLGLRRLRR